MTTATTRAIATVPRTPTNTPTTITMLLLLDSAATSLFSSTANKELKDKSNSVLQEKEWELEEERGTSNVMLREERDSRRGRRNRKGEN